MQIRKGNVVLVKHYSTVNPILSSIEEFCDERISVKLTKDFAFNNFLIGDPAVLKLEVSSEFYSIGCNLQKIDFQMKILTFRIDDLTIYQNHRSYPRFPVSLYTDVILEGTKKRMTGIIKDISEGGILLYLKESLNVMQTVDLDIYMEKNVILMKGTILRKAQGENYFEYGVSFVYQNYTSINYIRDYLKKIGKFD